MNIKRILPAFAITGALILGGGTGAVATGLIHGKQIAGDLTSRNIQNGSLHEVDLDKGIRADIDFKAKAGKDGKSAYQSALDNGFVGTEQEWLDSLHGKDSTVAGPKGDSVVGPKGDSYLTGAYYSVAFYDVGDTNAGAIATVTCKSHSDTAISGGVQVLGLGEGANSRNTPVSSSFAGRMDWSTNTPTGDLSGWIVQFGGNAGTTSDKSPEKVKIKALCVPNLAIPEIETYKQSS
jgi:hypothetical protein